MGEVQKIFLQSNTDSDNIKYKVTTVNLFKKQRPTKISQFSLKPTQINTRKRKAVWNKIKSTVLVHSYKIKIQ